MDTIQLANGATIVARMTKDEAEYSATNTSPYGNCRTAEDWKARIEADRPFGLKTIEEAVLFYMRAERQCMAIVVEEDRVTRIVILENGNTFATFVELSEED